MLCPRCGKAICNCLLEDPGYLARAVGKQLRLLGSEATGLATTKSGEGSELAVGGSQSGDADAPLSDNGGASTPQWLFDYCNQLAVQACGEPITLDVAAAPWNHKCERYFTEEQDGRTQPWDAKAVWLNCPYNVRLIDAFVKKAISEKNERGTTTIALLPDWGGYDYMDLCEKHGRIHRIKGPVVFTREDGSTFPMNCGFRSTVVKVVVFGPNVRPGFGKPIIKNGDTCVEANTSHENGDDGQVRESDDSDYSGDESGHHGNGFHGARQFKPVPLEPEERRRRIAATTLIHADVLDALPNLANSSVDAAVFDPLYPCIIRPYGTLTEEQWHRLMRRVLVELKRIVKPHGSVVVILQPNKEKLGRMRLWPWDFIAWAGRMWPDWGLVQDHYTFVSNTIPCAGANSKDGLMRQSVKWSVWLGQADCYRNQDAVLEEPSQETLNNYRTDHRPERRLGNHCIGRDSFRRTLNDRGGVTPHNMLIARTGATNHGHPAVTSYELAHWWCRYILPPGGVLLDPFCGSGTTLLAALDSGASKVIGIDKESSYLETARHRIAGEEMNRFADLHVP